MSILSRRSFIKTGSLAIGVLLMPNGKVFGAVSFIETVELVQKDLFPEATGVPALKEINALEFLIDTLNHSKVSDSKKSFIRNGVQWLHEESIALYKKGYTNLDNSGRQSVLKSISKLRWGDFWIYAILTNIFEAMLSDPIYGGNIDEAGWRWLGHSSGVPRPTEALL